jgi:hypothetical protein
MPDHHHTAADLAPVRETRRRGGRPRSEPDHELGARLSCALTRAERARVVAAAETRGLRPSQLLRARVLGERVPDPVAPRAAREAWTRLAPLQSNLNQLSAHLNRLRQAGVMPSADELVELPRAVSALHDAVSELRQELFARR